MLSPKSKDSLLELAFADALDFHTFCTTYMSLFVEYREIDYALNQTLNCLNYEMELEELPD